MAALKKRSASVDNVGHFYYDWALSRYKWKAEEVKNKQNNLPVQENGLSNENGEVFVQICVRCFVFGRVFQALCFLFCRKA